MNGKKVIAVTGATGAQGGGLVRSIVADPGGGFAARAITRGPDSGKARALADLGAEVIQADLDDEQSLARAFAGAHGAYCVTNFWEHFSPDREIAQAQNLAGAAKAAGLAHVIWSTLEDTRQWVPLDDDRVPTLHGKWKVPHFDGKGVADAVLFDWDNFIYFGMGPRPDGTGGYAITFPLGEKRLAAIAAEDIGTCAYGIVQAGEEYLGQTVGIMGKALTGTELAQQLTEALGIDVHYDAVPAGMYRTSGFPGAEDLGNIFQIKHDFEAEYLAHRDIALARKLNPGLQTFRDWLQRHASHIPV